MMMPLRKATKVIYIVQFVYCGSVKIGATLPGTFFLAWLQNAAILVTTVC